MKKKNVDSDIFPCRFLRRIHNVWIPHCGIGFVCLWTRELSMCVFVRVLCILEVKRKAAQRINNSKLNLPMCHFSVPFSSVFRFRRAALGFLVLLQCVRCLLAFYWFLCWKSPSQYSHTPFTWTCHQFCVYHTVLHNLHLFLPSFISFSAVKSCRVSCFCVLDAVEKPSKIGQKSTQHTHTLTHAEPKIETLKNVCCHFSLKNE